MAVLSSIAWCRSTWNPFIGCAEVSPGCEHCYAKTLVEGRQGRDFGTLRRTAPATFNAPLKWEREAAVEQLTDPYAVPWRVFAPSLSDFWHPDADSFREDAWGIIRQTPHLTYQILTKRPNRIERCLPPDWPHAFPHVHLGVSVESPTYAFRVDTLARIPAAVRFVSYEPALEAWMPSPQQWQALDWIVCGGESGPQARPFSLEWARELIEPAQFYGTALFIKQMGTRWAKAHRARDWKGEDPEEWPADLRIREWPMPRPVRAGLEAARV
jgi:protein gp37